ncbi:oxysterol-binding protein 1 [Marchantia polymorpha subsp. ruderalis]|uniref:PH domain-containing protein n=2 Tax=Marchantia polymorpha TaxID=3197 RepID=A0AAF6AYP9_MARPO|nr:hypothetical protein MARPO_0118s0012 [Marchantia polymorpha]BBN04883.1 hypothetical protein Mp_3g08540 [Marchantia polymorpha subsp. ruderalis]|eukprot:PTQ30875.1 hypothetical protein MARPO_0118s0012 [Marchantia polymorpha]
MHALCCISPVPLERESHPLTLSDEQSTIAFPMDQQNNHKASKPPINYKNGSSSPLMTKAYSSVAPPYLESVVDHDENRSLARSTTGLSVGEGSMKIGMSGDLTISVESRGCTNSSTNVGGILYKWVNYGKGWRPRWFVLQEGVLSYYKVHGPDKVSVNHERHKGLRVIGDEAQRLQRKQRNANVDEKRPRKPFGEVHLKVSSLRESKSDDKKFYIYTGTKTLHLRAETKEDKIIWLEALQAAKDLFPRNSLIYGLAPPPEEISLGTEKLRKRLLDEGLSEELVLECEQIILSEFSEVKDKFNTLQQRRIHLLERLRLLEAEKVELETTVVDEMQSQGGHASGRGLKYHGSETDDSDDEADKSGGMEIDSDEEDEIFFDTKETLGSYRTSSSDISSELSELDESGDMELVGFNYPKIQRRTKLPEPKEKEKSVSLWSMIKDNIGKDLTKVCLPVYFNEPISSLQRCLEDLEYSYLLDRAQVFGKQGNSLLRLLHVAAFAVSGYASTETRTCKPFNPLLGETYEADFPDMGLRFFSEKVSHHPMIVACHCDGRGWKFWGDSNLKSKFWGRSIQLDPVGTLTLQFEDGEEFQWSKVTTSIYNLILGKLYVDHYGTMRITGNRDLSCKLKFKEQSIIDRNPHQVQGYVHDKSGEKLATLFGKWDESMYYIMGDLAAKPKHYDPMSEAILLWRRNPPAENPTRYGFSSFAIALNELTPGLKERLPPTDSRLRPDQRHLENGEYEDANSEKLRLEQKQRRASQLQEKGWQPHWFRKEKGKDTFQYTGGYWEARKDSNWKDCPDIFGPDLPEMPAE